MLHWPCPPVQAGLSCGGVRAGMLLTTRAVMSASLPRVFEEVDNSGEVRPVEVPNHLNKIGGEFDAEELTAIATTTVRAEHAGRHKPCMLLRCSDVSRPGRSRQRCWAPCRGGRRRTRPCR